MALLHPNRPTTGPLLLLDTCGAEGTLALASLGDHPALLATETLPGRSASERLLPAIREMAARQGIALHSLAAIAVVYGPGSFTGVRIGVTAAKGLCEAHGAPLIAISRLAVLAHRLQLPASTTADQRQTLALLDAGRGEFYAGQYRGTKCIAETLLTREQVITLATTDPAPRLIASEPAVAATLEALGISVVPELTATDALPIALARLTARTFDDVATLDANYVRRTPAQIFAKPTPGSAAR